MIKRIVFLLGLFAAAASGAADRHAPPPSRWIPIQFKRQVPKYLVDSFKQIYGTDYSVIYNKGFRYAALQLRPGDRWHQDLIVYINDPYWCGSGGCSITIYKFTGSSYMNLGFSFCLCKVAFAGTVTNGY